MFAENSEEQTSSELKKHVEGYERMEADIDKMMEKYSHREHELARLQSDN